MDVPRKSAKKWRYIRRTVYLIVALSFIGFVTMGLSRLKPAVPSVDSRIQVLGTVKRGPMLRQVRGVGTLVSEDILWVPSAVQGRVVRIVIEAGAEVEPNTVILELSNPQLELEKLNAESELNSAKAKRISQQANLEDQLLGMEATKAQMEANWKDAKLTAVVDKQQFDEGLISELQFTQSQGRVEEQKKLLEINQKRFEMFRDQTKPAQMAETEAAVQKAQSLYDLACNNVDLLKVRAGKKGVLAQVKEKIEPGQTVSAGMILAKITNPDKLKAQLKVPEAQAKDLIKGLPAEVDTYHGVVSGEVSRIDPTVMEGNVTVDISLEGTLPKGARPDLSVAGTIEIERLDNVLNVERMLIISSDGEVDVFKLVEEGKFAERTRVRFGRTSVNTIEVLEGLQEGDEIIISDMSKWDTCDRIRLK